MRLDKGNKYNPYTLQFSYIPPQFIERSTVTNEIIENFVLMTGMADIMSKTGETIIKVDAIRNAIGMTSDTFTTYRKRLVEGGLLDGKNYGHLRILLPRFDKYIIMASKWN